MKKRSFTIDLFITSLAGLTSCSTSTTSMAMWKEVDFYDYGMYENLGPDEQGIDYYLMNDNCCYVRANMDVLENILSESQDKNINYDIPASYKGHTVKGVVGGGFGGPRVIYSFFETINGRGPLPRKSFSMGEADEEEKKGGMGSWLQMLGYGPNGETPEEMARAKELRERQEALVKQELEKGKDSENVKRITKEIMTDFYGIELPINWSE